MNYLTEHIINCINSKSPIAFIKFGDGEYACANNSYGCNCDADKYTQKKGNDLKNAFSYLVDNTDNSYIGCWHDISNMNFWKSLTTRNIKWVNYHSIIIDNSDMILKNKILYDKIQLIKTIKESNLKKIIVCNELLIKSKILLNIENTINISINNWYDNFYNILEEISLKVNNDECFIMITCCGIGAKSLISEVIKLYPNGIYLDFGSALDFICTKKDSRGFSYTYDDLLEIYKDILPENWSDPSFEYIYKEAQKKLGLHL